LKGAARETALDLRRLDYPYTERGAEPIFVAKALNASWGFFNRALFNLFFNPDKGSGHRIEGNDFRAVVESVADLEAGKADVRTFTFGPAEDNELLALVTDPDDWRLSEVYAVKGRFGEGKYKDEPAARVAGGRDPVFIGRCQSGLPAVGEFTQAVGEFYFGPGGPGGGYRVGLVPATFAEASLREAKEAGLLFNTSAFLAVGDDGHLLMTHTKGADHNAVHLWAYKTFFRQVWVVEVLGYKWYSLGQDLVGPGSSGKAIEELAGLTPKFVTLLEEFLPGPERARYGELQASFQRWQSGTEGKAPSPPFAGNVSGQGPGFAELPMPRPAPVGLLAIDKAGPSAFNLPVWEALRHCRADGSLARYLEKSDAKGVVLEIWDVERHRRAFLDLVTEAETAQRLLGATDKFNVKRVWTRTAAWDPAKASAALGDVLLAASTEKLAIISGGEYLGKDDPVLLAVEPLANGLNLFLRDRFYVTQGDGRGCHNMFPTPLPFNQAIATVNSRAVAVSALLSFDAKGEIRSIRDVFADPAYDEARERAYRLNKAIWDAHGGNFSPVGVGVSKVEKSYPLAKMIARITASGSPYEVKRPEA
jgi:fructose 1,6-bisphosphatase